MSDIDLLEIAKELWTLIEGGKCIVWVGAGLSAPAGYPGWRTTIDKLCSTCSIPALEPSEQSSKRLIEKAQECKLADPTAYCTKLAELFGKPVAVTRQAYNLLMRIPFKAYVTTNFDPLLAMAGITHNIDRLFAYPDLPPMELGADSRPIFYLHGLARRRDIAIGEDLILAQDDFETAYSSHVRMLLEPLLTYYPIIFLGCGLTEPAIREFFGRVHDIQMRIERAHPDSNRPRRQALLHLHYRNVKEESGDERIERDIERERDEEKRFNELGIKVLRYNPRDESKHYEIELVLEILCKFANVPISLTPRTGFAQEIML